MLKSHHFIYKLTTCQVFLALILLVLSCKNVNRSKVLYLYPLDRSQVVSVISNYSYNKRIIANGKHSKKPTSNYYELDISEVTELGDEIGICWKESGWEIVCDKSKITLSKIDTTQYTLREHWFKDSSGITNAKYYRKSNCFTVGFLNYSVMFPSENGHIERVR